MSRDKILGLALGILLIGFVGAFCLRLEKEPPQKIPRLKNPRKINRQIAEKPVIPYLTGVEVELTDEQKKEHQQIRLNRFLKGATEVREQAEKNSRFWLKPGFLDHQAFPDRGSKIAAHPAATPAAPDPIEPLPGTPPVASHSIPEKKLVAQPAASTQVKSPPYKPESKPVFTHVVQRGDTLSELAARYLGDSTRYLEIFRANRKVLKSPHDLRPGMTLRIPNVIHREARYVPPPISSRRSEQPNAASDLPTHMFTPVRRSPLTPRTSDNRTSRGWINGSYRNLTGLSLKGLPGIGELIAWFTGKDDKKSDAGSVKKPVEKKSAAKK